MNLYKFFDSIFEDIDITKCTIDYLYALIEENNEDFVKTYTSSEMTRHEAGTLISSLLHPYKYRSMKGNILTTSNEIDKLLEATDIGDDIPLSYLRPPFKSCYIEFTEERCSSLHMYNEESGDHILEGVYISETVIHPDTEEMNAYSLHPIVDQSKELRVLDLMFTGSPLGKSSNSDDSLRVQSLMIHQDNTTINSQLKFIEEQYGSDSDFANDLPYLSKALNHMAKVLLFINSKQYRDTAFNERSEIEKKIKSLKSPGKLKKYEKKLRRTYNRVIIKPEDNVVYSSVNEIAHSHKSSPKKAHWRKGHFRMQPYGPGAEKRKVIFIEPRIVGGIYANKKSYSAETKSLEPTDV